MGAAAGTCAYGDLLNHALAVESVMRYAAQKMGGDPEVWGVVGLCHDIDFEEFPDQHCTKVRDILQEALWPEELIRAIESHGWGICSEVEPKTDMEKVLYTIDELTGLVAATALVRPSKSILDMGVKSVKKKWKAKAFSAGVDRSVIERGAQMLQMEVSDSVPIGIYRIDRKGTSSMPTSRWSRSPGPVKGDPAAGQLFCVLPPSEDRDNWFDIMGRDHDIRGLVTEFECYTGETIWTRDSVRPVYDEDGTILFYDGALENVTLQKQNEEKLTFLATHDILTGLPNRNFFHDQAALTISQARYNGDLLAFMVFDLDYFNRINETFGTKVGDKLLQESALRVRTS